jgi:hypothetical protein
LNRFGFQLNIAANSISVKTIAPTRDYFHTFPLSRPGAMVERILKCRFLSHFSAIFLQEQYMEVVNPFILKNKERMIVFLDQLSSITDPNPTPGTMIEPNNLPISDTGEWEKFNVEVQLLIFLVISGRELATLHHICVSYLPELQNMAKMDSSIKKLVTVTEMLMKHRQKYFEMIIS